MRRVALLHHDQGLEQSLLDGLGAQRYSDLVHLRPELNGLAAGQTAEALSAQSPDVVVIGPGMDTLDALELAETIDREHPEITVVLVAEPTSDLWELALQAGVRSVVSPHDPPAQFRGAVERALVLAERRRSNLVIDLRRDEPTITPVGDAPRRTSRVITVLSPKGGSGKTTIATNLAAGLARTAPQQVAIVDLDLQFGDVASALRLDPTHTVADVPNGVTIDPATLKMFLTPHEAGLFALCGPEDPAVGEDIETETVHTILQTLAADFPFVVVDTGAGIEAAALSAVDVSTDIVLVGAMDVPSIRSLRKLIDALDRLGLTELPRHVVLNRADSRVGIEAAEVADILGLPITISVPSSRAIPLSVNHGDPVILSDPRSAVARPLQELVGLFADAPVPAANGLRLFRRTR